MLVVDLKQGESITGEAGSMTYMTPSIDVETRRRERSILGTIGLSILGRQSLFVNEFKAVRGSGQIGFAAAPVGDVQTLKIELGKGFIIQKAAYLASSKNVELDIKWEGFTKGIFGQGLFMIKTFGEGDLFINTFGAIDKHILAPDEEIIVDNYEEPQRVCRLALGINVFKSIFKIQITPFIFSLQAFLIQSDL